MATQKSKMREEEENRDGLCLFFYLGGDLATQ